MTNIPAFCKVLANPLRQEILLRVYGARDGMNVGTLADEMQFSGIKVSGISQYLGQLERLGVVRRYRAGKYVNYVADAARATPAVREAVGIAVRRLRKHDDLTPLFKVLMNPFRAQVVSVLSKVGALPAAEICEKTGHNVKVLKRDLQPAVDFGLLAPDDSDIPAATYRYIPPSDPAVRALIALV